MNRARRTPPPAPAGALLAVAALAACSGAPPRPPQPAPNDPPVAPLPIQPEPAPVPVPLPGERGDQDRPLLASLRLENGLDIALLRHRQDRTRTAEIAWMVRAGTAHGKPGASDLAAHLFAHGADLTAGRPGLQTEIERLGGTLAIEPGPESTWFTIRVADDRWRPALQALAQALQAPPPSRSLLERAHAELLQRRAAAILRSPLAETATRLLLGDDGGGAHLEALQERDPSEGVVFLTRHYRPDQAILALRVPVDPAAGEALVRGEFGAWMPATVTPEASTDPRPRAAVAGVHWARGDDLPTDLVADGACRAGLLFELPDQLQRNAAVLHLLLNCVTMEGIGGRLERLQHDAGLADVALRPTFVQCAGRSALLLETTTTPDRAARLYELAQAARRSLRDLPPTDSERALARGRAWLALRRPDAAAASSLRAQVLRVAQGVDEDRLLERLADLEQPDAIDGAAVAAFLQLPLALIAIGGEPPAGLDGAQPFDVVPPGYLQPVDPSRRDTRIDAAAPWLDKALRAIGGRDRIARLIGLQASMTIRTTDAPDIEETVEWTRDGRLHRARKVLGATVETDIRAGEWTERSGDEQLQLTPVEASWRLSEVERHPLALLIAHARGDLQFRMLSSKQVGDREHVLLEAVTERFERLRAQIDRESGLIRVVEAWTMAPEGTPTRTVDTWSDYRAVEGVRAPFRRETVVDDGQSRRVATYTTVVPLR
ncbi:MAG: insulinase family protein [Planctomycetota bacterium]